MAAQPFIGENAAAPSDGPWYQRPDVVVYTYILIVYSILSLVVLVFLFAKGYLDWGLNLDFSRGHTTETAAGGQIRQRRVNAPAARGRAAVGHNARRRAAHRASVETEIDFGRSDEHFDNDPTGVPTEEHAAQQPTEYDIISEQLRRAGMM